MASLSFTLTIIASAFLPIFALPIIDPSTSPEASHPHKTTSQLAFDISFMIVLFVALIGGFAWIGSRMTLDRLIGHIRWPGVNRAREGFTILSQTISSLRLTAFLERLAAATPGRDDPGDNTVPRGNHAALLAPTTRSNENQGHELAALPDRDPGRPTVGRSQDACPTDLATDNLTTSVDTASRAPGQVEDATPADRASYSRGR
ncbi:hypothetical protein BC834DRAFT_843511 [Gloeopeniophorella convolvens]|nr:hypothetical protein BC834DRAFT_843511 [Gloeopeniophorella convolvens]